MKSAAKLKKQIVVAAASVAAVLVFHVSSVLAAVSTGASQFFYDNGTSFTNPGSFSNVSRINNVWYFDGVAYPTPAPTSSSGYVSTVASVFSSMYAAVVFLSITGILLVGSAVFMAVKNAENEGLIMLTESTGSMIAIGVVCIVGAVLLGAMQHLF